MPEWVTYLIVFVAGLLVGGALRGRSRDLSEMPQPPPPLPSDVEPRVRALLAEGKKIEAIKLYREVAGVGLKDAKTTVEAIQKQMGF